MKTGSSSGPTNRPRVTIKRVVLKDDDVVLLKAELERQPYLSTSDRILLEALSQSTAVSETVQQVAASLEDVKE